MGTANSSSTWPKKWPTASPAFGLLRLSLFCLMRLEEKGRANPLAVSLLSGRQVFSKAPLGCAKSAPPMHCQAFSQNYSHSIVLGGLELISYTTLVTPGTSFTIRVEIRSSTSPGNRTQSAVMASSDSTTLTAAVSP